MSEKEKPSPAAKTGADVRPRARFVNVWRVSRAPAQFRESKPIGDAPASSSNAQIEPPLQPRRERPRASSVRKRAASRAEPIPLVAYMLDGHHLEIRPAPVQRDWMEATPERFAVRCLPLTIANGYGWELVCGAAFAVRWNGCTGKGAVVVEPDSGGPAIAASHFGHGILTFHVPCLFRTVPGFDLLVGGPVNRPKDGISPLSAIVETDWAPYGFTMNWMFTRAGAVVRFEKDEPFCHVLPLRRADLEATAPELRLLSENPELQAEHMAWQESRLSFNAGLEVPGSARAQRSGRRTTTAGCGRMARTAARASIARGCGSSRSAGAARPAANDQEALCLPRMPRIGDASHVGCVGDEAICMLGNFEHVAKVSAR